MYKLSSYCVHEHLFDNEHKKDFTLLYSSRTGKLLTIPRHAYEQIAHGQVSTGEAHTTLVQQLVQAEILVDAHEDELSRMTSTNIEAVTNSPVFKLVVQPTAACPLGCHYCGQTHRPDSLAPSKEEAVVRFAREQIEAKPGHFKELYVVWFGAEPLSGLPKIRTLSKKLRELADEHNLFYRADLVTNALLMTRRVAEMVVDELFVNKVEITLDGTAEFHDQRRHTKEGQPTFDRIFNGIKHLADLQKRRHFHISIRCNTDARNKDGVIPLLNLLAQHGLQNHASFYVAPLHSWGNDAHTLAAEKNDFSKWEIEWLIEAYKLGFKGSFLPRRKKQVCMAVSPNAYLVDPNGGVYGCTEVSLVDKYVQDGTNIHELGKIGESVSFADARDALPSEISFANFNQEVAEKAWPCSTCPVFPVCGGQCPKEWKEGVSPCPSFKYNLKERMLLAYLLKKNHLALETAAAG